MLKKYIKWLLFLSSYIPLYIILLILQWPVKKIALWILVVLIIVPFVVLLFTFRIINRMSKTFTQIKNIKYKNSEFAAYLFTYILPFLSGDFSQIKYVLVLSILYISIGFLYVKSNLLCANPILTILGYNLYEADDTKNNDLKNNSEIKLVKVSQNVYFGE
jgi:hypothetical protein